MPRRRGSSLASRAAEAAVPGHDVDLCLVGVQVGESGCSASALVRSAWACCRSTRSWACADACAETGIPVRWWRTTPATGAVLARRRRTRCWYFLQCADLPERGMGPRVGATGQTSLPVISVGVGGAHPTRSSARRGVEKSYTSHVFTAMCYQKTIIYQSLVVLACRLLCIGHLTGSM